MKPNRRRFLQAASLAPIAANARILGANDRVRIGAIGTGGRCRYLLSLVNKLPNTEIVALCDVYKPRLQQAKEECGPEARGYLDYHELLERKDIDAVVIGSPDHWHVQMTVDSVRAGKDVYVEKPVTHTIEEGKLLRKVVEASDRIVQVGYQQRSWPHFREASDLVHSGALGQIPLVLTYWYQNHLHVRKEPRPVDVANLDWKRWLGSAPDQPFNARRFYSWRWFWDFGGGFLTDLYSHWVDVAHWYMGSDTPVRSNVMGERYLLPNVECPDTINSYAEYRGNFGVVFNGTLNGLNDGGGLVFRGTNATLKIHRGGFSLYPEQSAYTETPYTMTRSREVKSNGDRTIDHLQNFLDCVKSREVPNSPVSSAIAAATAAHLGNLSLRRDKKIRYPEDVPV